MSEILNQVNDATLAVQDSLGNSLEVQFISMENVTINLRNFYTKAYLGLSSK
jgi:alpha-mannosidase